MPTRWTSTRTPSTAAATLACATARASNGAWGRTPRAIHRWAPRGSYVTISCARARASVLTTTSSRRPRPRIRGRGRLDEVVVSTEARARAQDIVTYDPLGAHRWIARGVRPHAPFDALAVAQASVAAAVDGVRVDVHLVGIVGVEHAHADAQRRRREAGERAAAPADDVVLQAREAVVCLHAAGRVVGVGGGVGSGAATSDAVALDGDAGVVQQQADNGAA